MILSIHVPMFGTQHTDAVALVCKCGANDWDWTGGAVDTLNPNQKLRCLRCGNESTVLWGLEEPDHVSTWLNGEYCPHRLCKLLAEQLRESEGWNTAGRSKAHD